MNTSVDKTAMNLIGLFNRKCITGLTDVKVRKMMVPPIRQWKISGLIRDFGDIKFHYFLNQIKW